MGQQLIEYVCLIAMLFLGVPLLGFILAMYVYAITVAYYWAKFRVSILIEKEEINE